MHQAASGEGSGGAGKPSRKPDAIVEESIGRHLKKLYDEVANEPVPDRFAELLKQLEQQEKGEED